MKYAHNLTLRTCQVQELELSSYGIINAYYRYSYSQEHMLKITYNLLARVKLKIEVMFQHLFQRRLCDALQMRTFYVPQVLVPNAGDEIDDATREKIAIVANHFVLLGIAAPMKESAENEDVAYVGLGIRPKMDLLDSVRRLLERLKLTGSNGSHRILGFAACQDVSDIRRHGFVRSAIEPIRISI